MQYKLRVKGYWITHPCLLAADVPTLTPARGQSVLGCREYMDVSLRTDSVLFWQDTFILSFSDFCNCQIQLFGYDYWFFMFNSVGYLFSNRFRLSKVTWIRDQLLDDSGTICHRSNHSFCAFHKPKDCHNCRLWTYSLCKEVYIVVILTEPYSWCW